MLRDVRLRLPSFGPLLRTFVHSCLKLDDEGEILLSLSLSLSVNIKDSISAATF